MKETEKIYIGIDFSKEKFNACFLTGDEILVDEREFANTNDGYRQVVKWVKSTSCLGRKFRPELVLFCGEHTGTYSVGLAEYLHEKGYRIWLECASIIKHSSGVQRGKNDAADARMIANYARRFYIEGETRLYEPDTAELKALRSLYTLRNMLVRNRVALNNQLKSDAIKGSSYAQRKLKSLIKKAEADTNAIEQEMIGIMEDTPEFAENYSILTSFKGVGPITAAVLIIHTGNFTRFTDSRKFACHCGVAPFGKQSGTSINHKPHVSHFAETSLKAALVQACKSAIHHNPQIAAYALRLEEKGKHHGIVMNNVKNKVLTILFKMIETKKKWDPCHEMHRKVTEKSDKPFELSDNSLHTTTYIPVWPSPVTGSSQYEDFFEKKSQNIWRET